MAFATNNDLHTYAPEVFDSGVDDWSTEIGFAETDVKNHIRGKWFNRYENSSQWNDSLLTESQWTKATVYKALYSYVLPKLSTFRPEGDPFMMQLTFYKERFAEEMDLQFGIGIEYDENNDATVTDSEKNRLYADRLYR